MNSNQEIASVSRVLFNEPFDPKVNFALEDPLLLSSNKQVLQKGIEYARYFGSGSFLSTKAAEFIEEKKSLEVAFSKKVQQEGSILLKSMKNSLFTISKTFSADHPFFLPSINPPKVIAEDIHYYCEKDLIANLCLLLEKNKSLMHPVIYLEKSAIKTSSIDFSKLAILKKTCPFFLIVENNGLFGVEGHTGYGSLEDLFVIDLLITQIPKTFGKLLTIVSSKKSFLQKLGDTLTCKQIFPPPAYIGMLFEMMNQMDVFSKRRDKLNLLKKNLKEVFPKIKIKNSHFSIPLESIAQINFIHKELINKGFLLPYNAISFHCFSLNLYLNYKQEISSFIAIKYCVEQSQMQHISETI